MGKWKRYIPDGMKDILFEECNEKLTIEESLRKSYKQSGFSEIISPTLEFYDVFDLESQSISQEKMYKLFDNAGRIMVLRPDMTTPIGRIASTKIKQSNYPLRLCYNSNIFRINENLNGKTSEITQSGIEIIGVKNIKADAEAIINAIEALLNLGLKNFKIELGEAKFFKALIEDTEINEEDLEKMRSIIENKNYVTLSNFLRDKQYGISEDNIEILEKLPQLFGDISIIDEARSLTNNQKALEALDNIHNIYKIIHEIGLSSYISIDLGMVQNIDYYTGIIFKGYVEEVGDYILSGGRYDNLIKQFGTNLPATGFAINVDNVMDALKKQNTLKIKETKKIVIYYKEEYLKNAYELMNLIRQNDFICELSLFSKENESIEYGKENKIHSMISIIDENNLKVFDLLTDECDIVKMDKFLSTLVIS
ncbi:ATP phosphoribosyltransferase regulatory subunit [Clostridium homopropionicum DSM 5847]|uniref:ATP phosphoribosyltransferase regulatory subunit n=1 Tax=Clostridium homopropionicum DSM 5847 TaxID=1121318 RepID=A0A0L6ZAG0_9CLOT|nr:ATP phosphoribosyltransferase regulatory subunit [Clostridium homopropionicum]KOA19959.1 ATP phosphoribosyltransferase regulatory subunit [Clostridium homopropionicum DSM 5847]SFG88607.1 ATP phosphoribosyltransferase regulatory subunit [Clostridium homopropionicum]